MAVKMEYRIEGLDCGNCALAIQNKLEHYDKIEKPVVNFTTQILRFEVPEDARLDVIEAETKKIITGVEAGVSIVPLDRKKKAPEKEEDSSRRILIRLIAAGTLFFGMILTSVFLPGVPAAVKIVVFAAAYLIAGGDVLLRAGKNILKGRIFDENFLMSIATIGAWVIGEYIEAVAVMLFYQLGEYFQERAVNHSRRSIRALTDLRPDSVRLLSNGREIIREPESAVPGDVFKLLPGERVPLDGEVLEGSALVDLSALTGESVPRQIRPGDEILSGSINNDGVLIIKVKKAYKDSAVARIMEMVEEASERKAHAENFITRFARYYTPAVFFGAILLAVVPPLFFGQVWGTWVYRALVFLVASCPCALVVSIPLSFFSGLGTASREGVLVKGSNYLDVLARAERVVFDKTGTLTRGIFEVTGIKSTGILNEDELLALAASVEKNSNHPLARAVSSSAGKKNLGITEPEDFQELRGFGVKGTINGRKVLAGTRRFMEEERVRGEFYAEEATAIHLARDGEYLGCLTCEDDVKPDSRQTIEELRELGLKESVMLTGDSPEAANRAGSKLGITQVFSSLLPHQKVEILEELEKGKDKGRTILFAGDGINDTPILARADAGIAMGALGSDAAIEAADVVVMDDNPSRIPTAIRVARKTRRIVNQNIILALGVKSAVLLLGALGIASLWAAVFADVGTALLAVFNSLRITRGFKAK